MPELRPRDAKTGRFTSQDPKPGKDRIDKLMDTLVEVRNSMATKEDLAEVRADLGEAKADLGEVKADLGEVRADLGEVKADLGEAKADLGEVRADLGEVKADLGEVKADLGEAKSNMATSEGLKTLRSELRFEMEERNITLFNHMKTMEGNILRAIRGLSIPLNFSTDSI